MDRISVVVPDGSMQEVVMGLFAKAGMSIAVERKRTKEGKVEVNWISKIAFQRPQEIPQYLNNGHFDVAIVGEDWIANCGYKFPVLLELPIGRSGKNPVSIVLAVAKKSGYREIKDLPVGCEVATEYVQLTEKFFAVCRRSDIRVIPSYGNTEHKIRFGASGIVDVTESGSSLEENDLEVIWVIMKSNTVIVANPKSFSDIAKKPYIDCFVRLINGAFQATKYVVITVNVPGSVLEKASQIIGGLKGPSCSPIIGAENWFALQSVVLKEAEDGIIFDLLQIGVTDIIVNRDIPTIMS